MRKTTSNFDPNTLPSSIAWNSSIHFIVVPSLVGDMSHWWSSLNPFVEVHADEDKEEEEKPEEGEGIDSPNPYFSQLLARY